MRKSEREMNGEGYEDEVMSELKENGYEGESEGTAGLRGREKVREKEKKGENMRGRKGRSRSNEERLKKGVNRS